MTLTTAMNNLLWRPKILHNMQIMLMLINVLLLSWRQTLAASNTPPGLIIDLTFSTENDPSYSSSAFPSLRSNGRK